jgi:hypothetical protein
MAGFMEYVRIDIDGTVVSATTDSGSAYLRLWQVQDLGNPSITIAIFAGIGAATPLELVRGSGPR